MVSLSAANNFRRADSTVVAWSNFFNKERTLFLYASRVTFAKREIEVASFLEKLLASRLFGTTRVNCFSSKTLYVNRQRMYEN